MELGQIQAGEMHQDQMGHLGHLPRHAVLQMEQRDQQPGADSLGCREVDEVVELVALQVEAFGVPQGAYPIGRRGAPCVAIQATCLASGLRSQFWWYFIFRNRLSLSALGVRISNMYSTFLSIAASGIQGRE